ncbi:GGDEF domain-containing protein [Bacillus sp. V5-8f]|uniref:GGDEF domain-containing protein n=1 Tax=Bacillus sp. V5-8f TaxID=2053044 RepID=UPI000C7725A0|nr:GGDEF domain-containing protein [Bacillus sp. V5-8f]PLT34075.1 hypothetical protein CUU64_10750 [Bacillus sp. V5-8f]
MLQQFEELKRKIFLVAFPFFGFSLLINQYFYKITSTTLHFEDFLKDYLLLAWFLTGFVLLILKRNWFRAVEVITLIVVTSVLLLYFQHIIFMEIPRGYMHDSGGFLFWVPLLYISIFFTLHKKKALFLTITIHTVNAAMAALAFSQYEYSEDTSRILLNFFISQYVFILSLFYLQELFKVYLVNQQLRDIAHTDHLTGLPNRRKIDEILTKQFEGLNPAVFSIILFDIDHFKSINDTYGHDVGDQVLKEMSSLLKINRQENQFFGRWGGEEFILIQTGDSSPEIEAERIRSMINSHQFIEVYAVTASFGVATYRQGDDKYSLLSRADAALYKSKENGRNQVQFLT